MDIKTAFLFFKELHKDQKYEDWLPYRPHLLKVGEILQNTLERYNETDIDMINKIIVAWYGHDSIEDTDITMKELKEQFDDKIAELIRGMTNEDDDTHTDRYIQKVSSWLEEVRLIKLADMCANYQWIIKKAKNKENAKFFKEKILPIIEPMYQKVTKTSFIKYPKTSESLISDAKKLHDLAIKTIDNMIK